MNGLSRVRVGFSPLSGRIMLYRHGKDPRVALERRDAEAQVVSAVVEWVMHDAPKGATVRLTIDGRQYDMTVVPVPADPEAAASEGETL